MRYPIVVSALAAAALALAPMASAAPDYDAYEAESTVLLSEIDDAEDQPIATCWMEDGSDIIPRYAGRCIWTDPDTGDAYLTYEDRSYVIIDDTVRPGR